MAKIRHTGIVINNIEESLKFYSILGFKEIKRETLSANTTRRLLRDVDKPLTYIKLVSEDNCLLELYYFEAYKKVKKEFIGLNHIAFTVKNLYDIYYKFRDLDVKIISHPIEQGKVRLFFCTDFNNNLLEIVEDK